MSHPWNILLISNLEFLKCVVLCIVEDGVKKCSLHFIILGDLTELQIVALRWRALAQQVKDGKNPVHFKVLYEALKDLDKEWDRDLLSNEEVSLSGYNHLSSM